MVTAVKSVMKAVLPRPVLESVHAYRADDERLWKLLAATQLGGRSRGKILYSRTSVPFADIDPTTLSPTAAFALFEPWRAWEQREAVTTIEGPAFIAPDGGWIIRNPWHLVPDCVIDSSLARKPSFERYVRARLSRGGTIRRESKVISLRDWGEVNYWHFLNDLIGGRLRLAESCELSPDIPVVLGRRAYDMPFVRDFVEKTGLGGRRFIVQGDEYIRCDEVVAFETARHSLPQVEFVRRLLGSPAGNDAVARRVFLVRRPASGRSIQNMEAVEHVCHRFGFHTVMTEGMSLEQQIRLFSETRYLVAVHGAGLTNMMFRRGAPLSVLEIFPAASYHGWDGPSPHYFWMAHALGFEYDAMFGDGAPDGMFRTPFRLDPDHLGARLSALCS